MRRPWVLVLVLVLLLAAGVGVVSGGSRPWRRRLRACYRTKTIAMNLFCRLLGHTWVPRSDNPKIRWTAAENMSEMQMTMDQGGQKMEMLSRTSGRRLGPCTTK